MPVDCFPLFVPLVFPFFLDLVRSTLWFAPASALALLMPWVNAYHADDAIAANNLTIPADFLY